MVKDKAIARRKKEASILKNTLQKTQISLNQGQDRDQEKQ